MNRDEIDKKIADLDRRIAEMDCVIKFALFIALGIPSIMMIILIIIMFLKGFYA